MNKTNSSFEYKNGLNFKLEHRKAQMSILSERLGDRYATTGDRCRVRESWHICGNSLLERPKSSVLFTFQRDFPKLFIKW